ncbi:MAG: sugar transferase [Candidatus Saganbacteria bacterium]|nr:sugar transferase [Candidatus Saganbacteria bacterium]
MKLLIDALLINISFILAYYFRFEVLAFIGPEPVGPIGQYGGVLIFVTILWLAVFNLIGFYRNERGGGTIDELARIVWGVSVASLLLFGLLFLYRGFWFSRLLILNAWWMAIFLIGFSRIIASYSRIYLLKRGIGVGKVLILGENEIAKLLFNKFLKDKSLGYVPVGYVGPDPKSIKQSIITNQVDELIIASSNLSHQQILDIITECEVLNIKFKIVPGLLELIASRVDVDEVGGIPLITVSEIGLSGIKAAVKRIFDVLLSFFLLILLIPLFLLVAVLVKIDSKGAVFFKQLRVGKNGTKFNCYKFRSMVSGAQKLLSSLEEKSEVEGHIFKIKEDPRVTRIGKFIRKFSIDELPQLFNVLLGEMSLVGPRPPLPHEVEKYSSWHLKRLRITPGITGLWQVSGRSLLPFEDMVRLDIYYIENWSLWLDIKLLFKTIPAVLFGSGAY